MHPKSEAVVEFARSVPEEPIGLRDAQVPDVIHALASDSAFNLAGIPAIMVNDLGRPQSEADAMAAKIAAVQSSAAALKAAIDALNAILDG